MRLNGQTAVVTGGAQGIGLGIVSRLAAEGAAVMIADINDTKAQEALDRLRADGATVAYTRCDVSNEAQVDNLFSQTLAQFGRVDILVNNAALVHNPKVNVHFLELDSATWHRSLDINLSGMFYCAQRAAKIMVKQTMTGHGAGGVILNMGSGGGSRAHRMMVAYDTTKGGIEAATRAMALDLAPWAIRVNTLVPGNTQVENMMGGAIGPDAARLTIPLGHSGKPADIGATAAFLASDDGRYITGQRFIIDGGMDAQLRSPGVDSQIDVERVQRGLS